jgi:AbrB family looped-hinge helix DNA binding protein
MAIFKSRLVRWGNSVGISIPKPIRDTLNLQAGDEVQLIDKEDYIILKKAYGLSC